jgi:hypothetical protein
MSRSGDSNYFRATLHPVSCLLFILPLLAVYEVGLVWLGISRAEMIRNGVDSWLRWSFQAVGLRQPYLAPAILALFLLGWAWVRRHDRPGDLLAVWIGMAIESSLFALALWGVSLHLEPLLNGLGITLDTGAQIEPVLGDAISFLGAGVYEEVLFRMLLFSGLLRILQWVEVSGPMALLLAALTSATLFSCAHHIGPHGEPFHNYIFLFRTIAGLFFTAIYQLRGLGIAVGAHTVYDVLVGVLIGNV